MRIIFALSLKQFNYDNRSAMNNKRNIITGLLRRSAFIFSERMKPGSQAICIKNIKYSSGLMDPKAKTGSGRADETSQLDAASAAPMHSLVDELQAFYQPGRKRRHGKR